jgi:hypothetical protein
MLVAVSAEEASKDLPPSKALTSVGHKKNFCLLEAKGHLTTASR